MVDTLCDEIELHIACRSLKNLNLIGKSDPVCVLSEFHKKTNSWEAVGQTEVAKNNLNPDWKPIRMKFFFEKTQKLKFEVFDSDKNKPTKPMGWFETTLSKIMGKKQQVFEGKLNDGGDKA